MHNEIYTEELRKRLQIKWDSANFPDFTKFIEYKLYSERYQDENIQKLTDILGLDISDKKVLDIGSGEGGFVTALRNKDVKAYGVDIQEENIEISNIRLKCNNIKSDCNIFQLISGDGNLPFESDHFDLISLFEVLEHVPLDKYKKLLTEINRVLKPEGIVFIEVPNRYWPYEGHINRYFFHWFKGGIRRTLLKYLVRNNLGVSRTNYLDDIIYMNCHEWYGEFAKYLGDSLNTDLLAYRKIYAEPYTFGRFKILKKIIKIFLRVVPKKMIVLIYHKFGPVCYFAFKKL